MPKARVKGAPKPADNASGKTVGKPKASGKAPGKASRKASRKASGKASRKASAPNDSTGSFEAATSGRATDAQRFVLRLFIAGTTPRSTVALANLKAICEEHLAGRYDLEVIDIYQQPQRARIEHIVAVPTLVKLSPSPPKKLIGDLSHVASVLAGLGLGRKRSAR